MFTVSTSVGTYPTARGRRERPRGLLRALEKKYSPNQQSERKRGTEVEPRQTRQMVKDGKGKATKERGDYRERKESGCSKNDSVDELLESLVDGVGRGQ